MQAKFILARDPEPELIGADWSERDFTSLDLRPAVIPSGCKSRLSIDERDMEEFQLETEMGDTAEPGWSQEAHSESTRA